MRRLPRLSIELLKGQLKITQSGLFLDAHRRSECAFVSHAHGDHIARHDRTIATQATVALMRHRFGARRLKGEALPVAYRKPFGLADLTLELFPAGHVLGSAQLRVTRNGVALGYSGDLCLEPTLTAEEAEVVECDVLVLESTFGLPRYVFPPKHEVLRLIRSFVDNALSDRVTPVLLAYALGKAQEILKYLGEAGYRCRAHPVVHAVNRVYQAEGVALPNVELLGPEGPSPGEVVVVPPHLSRSSNILRTKPWRRSRVFRRTPTAVSFAFLSNSSCENRNGRKIIPSSWVPVRSKTPTMTSGAWAGPTGIWPPTSSPKVLAALYPRIASGACSPLNHLPRWSVI